MMNVDFYEKMRRRMDEISVKLNDHQFEQFYQYYDRLIEKNKVMNLTAITDMDEVIGKHFADSLALGKVKADLGERSYSVMDVGTGAGFPGIPLKIAFPDLRVTLLDSLNKRVKFLQEVIDELGLDGIDAIHGRAEDLGHDDIYRARYDLCVSRAVANLSTLTEYCVPFVQKDGYFIAYKSGRIEEEVESAKSAIGLLGGKLEQVMPFCLAGEAGDLNMSRSFVKIRKVKETAKKYPRKAGMPSKEPL